MSSFFDRLRGDHTFRAASDQLAENASGSEGLRGALLFLLTQLRDNDFETLDPSRLRGLLDRFCQLRPREERLSASLLHSALLALCCQRLRDVPQERCRRLLLLWNWLTDEEGKQGTPGAREDGRWVCPTVPPTERLRTPWPSEVVNDPRARELACAYEALLGGIEAAGRCCYPVYFPTAGDRTVLSARLTALADGPNWAGDWPNLVVAPWSVLTLARDNLNHLRELLAALPGLGVLAAPPRFLIEFVPAFEARRPRSLLVTGNSLDLAVCLAAWAAAEGRTLRRLCVTGEVEAGSGTILPVGGLEDKVAVLREFVAEARRPVVLLVPQDNYHAANASAGGDPRLTVNGRRHDTPEVEPARLPDLADPGVLTDRFDDYRQAVLDHRVVTVDGFERLGPTDGRPTLVCCAAFDDPPLPVAAAVARQMVQQTHEAEGHEQGSAAESPVPFLFPLEAWDAGEADDLDGVVRLLADVRRCWDGAIDCEPDDFFVQSLHDAARFAPERLCLIVYCANSLRMRPYEEVRARLERVRRHLKKGSRLVLIASDAHHERMLAEQFQVPVPAPAF